MKKDKKFNKKQARYILKEIFKVKNRKQATVSLQKLSSAINQKYLLTSSELAELLTLFAELKLVDILAKNEEKEYTYTIKLTNKGEVFLRQKTSKLADFFIGIFVYLAFMLVLFFLIFALRRVFIAFNG